MQAFEYAIRPPFRKRWGCSPAKWGEADVLAGGTDLLALMKDRLHKPKPGRQYQEHQRSGSISKSAEGLRIGAL